MLVSPCCHAPVLEGKKPEYPLGGSQWGIGYKVEYCESCGNEVEETLEACGVCGEVECVQPVKKWSVRIDTN